MGTSHSQPMTFSYPYNVTPSIKRNFRHDDDSLFESETLTPSPSTSSSYSHHSLAPVNFFDIPPGTKYPGKYSPSSSISSGDSIRTSYSDRNRRPSVNTVCNMDIDHKAATLLGASVSIPFRMTHPSLNPKKTKHVSNYHLVGDRHYWRGHSTVDFSLPCDLQEGVRLKTMHHILKSMLQGNFLSPIRDTLTNVDANVLDIGCGDGTWTLDMAHEFPNAEFYGIDECPLFPTTDTLPNINFQLHNVLEPLPFDDNQFDFIYMRSMILYYTPAQLVSLLSEISRILKPGGYFEVLDTAYMINNPGKMSESIINHQLVNTLLSQSRGAHEYYDANNSHPIFTLLMIAPQTVHSTSSFMGNFVDVHQEHLNIPIGWGGKLGGLHAENYEQLLASIKLKYADHCMMNSDEIKTIMMECKRHKSSLDYFSCYARKPLSQNGHLEQNTLESIYEFVEGYMDEY